MVAIFAIMLRRRCSTGFKIDFWLLAKFSNIKLTLVSSLQLKQRKHSAGRHV